VCFCFLCSDVRRLLVVSAAVDGSVVVWKVAPLRPAVARGGAVDAGAGPSLLLPLFRTSLSAATSLVSNAFLLPPSATSPWQLCVVVGRHIAAVAMPPEVVRVALMARSNADALTALGTSGWTVSADEWAPQSCAPSDVSAIAVRTSCTPMSLLAKRFWARVVRPALSLRVSWRVRCRCPRTVVVWSCLGPLVAVA
jgi:hypothetical protein